MGGCYSRLCGEWIEVLFNPQTECGPGIWKNTFMFSLSGSNLCNKKPAEYLLSLALYYFRKRLAVLLDKMLQGKRERDVMWGIWFLSAFICQHVILNKEKQQVTITSWSKSISVLQVFSSAESFLDDFPSLSLNLLGPSAKPPGRRNAIYVVIPPRSTDVIFDRVSY